MKENPWITLRQVRQALDTDLSLPTLSRALQHLGWSKYLGTGWRKKAEAGASLDHAGASSQAFRDIIALLIGARQPLPPGSDCQ
jgi:hypothetical protein